jgi:hypothetical protein
VKIEKKFSNGLQFLGSYAWGHYIDEGGSGFSQSSAPQIDNNFAADRADGTFDFRHIFTGNWVYDLPAGHGRRFLNNSNPIVNTILGGWEFIGITHFNTGGPLGINIGGLDNANVGQRSLSQRPDLVSGQPQRLTLASGTDQTTGYVNKESVQFRAEFFNAFNHVNLGGTGSSCGGIDGTLVDATFGSIGCTQNDSREIQFALKLYF